MRRVTLKGHCLAQVNVVHQEQGGENTEGEDALILTVSSFSPCQLEDDRSPSVSASRSRVFAPRITQIISLNLTVWRTAISIDQVVIITGRVWWVHEESIPADIKTSVVSDLIFFLTDAGVGPGCSIEVSTDIAKGANNLTWGVKSGRHTIGNRATDITQEHSIQALACPFNCYRYEVKWVTRKTDLISISIIVYACATWCYNTLSSMLNSKDTEADSVFG